MKTVAIITENKYPQGDAGAVRQHATAKIFQTLGYHVTVVGYGESAPGEVLEYDRVAYTSFRPKSRNRLQRLCGRIFFGCRALRFIKKYCDDVKALVVVDVFPWAFKQIERYAKKNGIILIHDSVEWYSPEEFSNGEANLQYRLKEHTNLKAVKEQWRVIAISRYLKEHFSKQCQAVVRIPAIMDVDSIPYRIELSENSDKVRFVYAGAPGRKDYLSELLSGFSLLSTEQLQRLEVHIVGVNREQLLSVCGVPQETLDRLGHALVAHGRVPREEAIKWVSDADHTLLLRDETLRYAKAGFPTKIVESLSCGTPPVCNLSSDLELYLKDGENAFIIDGNTPQDVCNTIARVLSVNTDSSARREMREKARATAECHFDYKNYVDALRDLMQPGLDR